MSGLCWKCGDIRWRSEQPPNDTGGETLSHVFKNKEMTAGFPLGGSTSNLSIIQRWRNFCPKLHTKLTFAWLLYMVWKRCRHTELRHKAPSCTSARVLEWCLWKTVKDFLCIQGIQWRTFCVKIILFWPNVSQMVVACPQSHLEGKKIPKQTKKELGKIEKGKIKHRNKVEIEFEVISVKCIHQWTGWMDDGWIDDRWWEGFR